jgi:hypothetical protein
MIAGQLSNEAVHARFRIKTGMHTGQTWIFMG